MNNQTIQNPWAVCYASPGRPSSIGYIIGERLGVLEIKDSDNPHHKAHHWGEKNVERYPTLKLTIDRFIETRGGKENFEEILNQLANDFPSQFTVLSRNDARVPNTT